MLLGLAMLAGIGFLSDNVSSTAVIPYSRFQQYLDGGKVRQVTVSGNIIRGTLNEAMPDGKTQFSTIQVQPDLASTLAKRGVEFSGVATGGLFSTLLSWIIPPLLFVGIWIYASRAMMGGGSAAAGRSSSAPKPA